MKRLAGQAGRFFGAIAHVLGLLFLTAATLVLLLLFLLAFRLSLGPIQLPGLAAALANTVSGQGIDIRVGQAALAWGGYHKGGAVPLYIQLGKVTASNAAGVTLGNVPDARLVFLPSALFGSGAPILVNSADAHFAGATSAVSLRAAIRLNFGFRLSRADLFITLGPGDVLGEPIRDGTMSAEITPRDVRLDNTNLTLTPSGGSAPLVAMSGAAHLDKVWSGTLTVSVTSVRAADLGVYWPPGLSGSARGWILKNITAGDAHDAKLVLQLAAPGNLASVAITGAQGGFAGDNISMNWLPGAVPITALNGQLTVLDPDRLRIMASSARLGGLLINSGTMTIAGLSHADQAGTVAVTMAGKIQDAIAVLNAPGLHLLGSAPPELAAATGGMRANVTASFPFKTNLKLSQVKLDLAAKLSDATVPGPVGGLGLSGGALALQASTTGLTVSGPAQFAGAPAMVAAKADFTKHPVLRDFTLQTVLGTSFFHQLGLDPAQAPAVPVQGKAAASLRVTADDAGMQEAALTADISGVAAGVPALGWSKPAGAPGALALAGTVADDGTLTLTRIDATGPALDVQGIAAGPDMVFKNARIGGTVASGSITPPRDNAPWRVDLHGHSLSLRAILNPPQSAADRKAAAATPGAAPASGPAWTARLDFFTLRLAKPPAPVLRNFRFSGAGAGGLVLSAQARAWGDADAPLMLNIRPATVPRRHDLRLTAGDAGGLLRVLGAYADLQGGALDLHAQYGNRAAVTGRLTLDEFSLLQAPAIGKILQGLTIYGVAEAASGPGLSFNHAIVPFSIATGNLTLNDARAFSEALGFTASGTIALADGACDLSATIIPAYALNALPGKIPVLGKLFTAEKGGGLISVRVKVSGTLDDPKLSFNPFSALTPGVLRDVFGSATGARQ